MYNEGACEGRDLADGGIEPHLFRDSPHPKAKKAVRWPKNLESFEPKEGSHPCDLSESSDDEMIDDDATPQEIDEGGNPGSTLDTSLDVWKCDWGVHYKNCPAWRDAYEAILAGPQGEWPEGVQIFDNRMVRGGVICVPTPFKSF